MTAIRLVSRAAFALLSVALILGAMGHPPLAGAETTITCPTGMYDMLDWMTMDSSLRSNYHLEGNSNRLYTVVQPASGNSGKFYWVKNAVGYPWDIQLYDNNYIYLWITELSWTVPQSYKKFINSTTLPPSTNLPLVPRCAIAHTTMPGSTITVSNTNYDLHTACSSTCSVTLGLENAVNEVWGPYSYSYGGNLPNQPLQTLVISYRYNCNAAYQCMDKEEYYLAKKYGLVQWTHSIWVNGAYAQLQKTVFNELMAGIVTPDFPCGF